MSKVTIIAFALLILALGSLNMTFKQEPVIIISQSVIDNLNTAYEDSRTEFVYCLQGSRNNQEYKIESYYEPKVINASENEVISARCGYNTLGTIHPHFNSDYCRLSNTDSYTFGSTQLPLTGVMCGKDKFVFFTPNDLEKPVEVLYE